MYILVNTFTITLHHSLFQCFNLKNLFKFLQNFSQFEFDKLMYSENVTKKIVGNVEIQYFNFYNGETITAQKAGLEALQVNL